MLKILGELRLTKDVDLKVVSSGKKVANVSAANNRGTGDNRQTDFIDLIGWENLADAMVGLKKGDLVNVSGVFQTRTWTDKSEAERKNLEIVLDSIALANVIKKTGNESTAPKKPAQTKENKEEKKEDFEDNDLYNDLSDEDIPF